MDNEADNPLVSLRGPDFLRRVSYIPSTNESFYDAFCLLCHQCGFPAPFRVFCPEGWSLIFWWRYLPYTFYISYSDAVASWERAWNQVTSLVTLSHHELAELALLLHDEGLSNYAFLPDC